MTPTPIRNPATDTPQRGRLTVTPPGSSLESHAWPGPGSAAKSSSTRVGKGWSVTLSGQSSSQRRRMALASSGFCRAKQPAAMAESCEETWRRSSCLVVRAGDFFDQPGERVFGAAPVGGEGEEGYAAQRHAERAGAPRHLAGGRLVELLQRRLRLLLVGEHLGEARWMPRSSGARSCAGGAPPWPSWASPARAAPGRGRGGSGPPPGPPPGGCRGARAPCRNPWCATARRPGSRGRRGARGARRRGPRASPGRRPRRPSFTAASASRRITAASSPYSR